MALVNNFAGGESITSSNGTGSVTKDVTINATCTVHAYVAAQGIGGASITITGPMSASYSGIAAVGDGNVYNMISQTANWYGPWTGSVLHLSAGAGPMSGATAGVSW